MTPTDLKRAYAEYLEYSLRYYHYDESVVPDDYFDELCKTLLKHWKDLKHKDKRLTKRSDLEAGTGMSLTPRHLPHLDWLVRKHRGVPLKEVFDRGDHPTV